MIKRTFVLYNETSVLCQAKDRAMPKVTEEHVDARRRQILSGALRCFAREGFYRTTMQDIFREAGLSPGAVYSYFKGKDELIAAITLTIVGFIAESAGQFGEPLPDGRMRRPGEALSELIANYRSVDFGTAAERARIFPHLAGEQQRNPALNAAARAGLDGLRASGGRRRGPRRAAGGGGTPGGGAEEPAPSRFCPRPGAPRPPADRDAA